MATTDRASKDSDLRRKAAVDDRLAAATQIGKANASRGSLATSARYESGPKSVVIELASGVEVKIPVHLIEGLGELDDSVLREVRVEGVGHGLHWPSIDLDLSVAGLIAGCFGTRVWMATLGKQGGSVQSEAKRRAARDNGKKGGRPRKQAIESEAVALQRTATTASDSSRVSRAVAAHALALAPRVGKSHAKSQPVVERKTVHTYSAGAKKSKRQPKR